MKKLVLASLFAFGCAGTPAANQGRLVAGADAQHVGVYSYAVEGDVVTLFDKDGAEFGRVAVTEPSSEGRHFDLVAVDGTTDEVDVVKPMDDGRFFAPITPETMLTATLADPALAAHWATHQVSFSINLAPRMASTGLLPSDTANTSTCSTYSCGQSCTPLGCAKPANTSVGCSNPSQLPATWIDSRAQNILSNYSYSNPGACAAAAPGLCQQFYGGSSKDWTFVFAGNTLTGGSTFVNYGMNDFRPVCLTGTTTNSWVASCPPSTCTAPNYDAVPRNGSCNNPGSCSYSQGAVTCTTYH